MPATLLASQLATLETLVAGEDGVVIVVDGPPDAVADRAVELLGLESAEGFAPPAT